MFGLAVLTVASARLWVSGEMLLASDGRVWARSKSDGHPAAKPYETRLKVLDAASWKDGGFYVVAESDGTCVVAKITPLDGKAPVVKQGFSHPLAATDLCVQPFGSGDVVVHERGSHLAWLYSKSTYWSEVTADASRSDGVVQGGVLFYLASGAVCHDSLSKYSSGHVARDYAAFRFTDCPSNQRLIQTEGTDSFVLSDRTTLATSLHPVERGEAVSLGRLPDSHAVVYRAKDGTPYFAWIGASGGLLTKKTGRP